MCSFLTSLNFYLRTNCHIRFLHQGLKVLSTNSSATKSSPDILKLKNCFSAIREADGNVQHACKLLVEAFKCSESKARDIVLQNSFITKNDVDILLQKADFLSTHLAFDDVFDHPKVLKIGLSELQHGYEILKELGMTQVTAIHLTKFPSLKYKSLCYLRTYLLPENVEPLEIMLQTLEASPKLQKKFKLSSKDNYSQQSLVKVREIILREYLADKLDFSAEDTAHLFENSPIIKKKSFSHIKSSSDFLLRCSFSLNKIKSNSYLLCRSAEAMESILEIPHIGGKEPLEFINGLPRILTVSSEKVKVMENVMNDFKVTGEQIQKCRSVYMLSPETVVHRLEEVHRNEDFKVLRVYRRMLNLVNSQDRAKKRLKQLQGAGFQTFSLDLLTCAKLNFNNYFSFGEDRCRGLECLTFLGLNLGKSEAEVKAQVSAHPKMKRFYVTSVAKLLPALLERGLTNRQLWHSLPVFFYNADLVLSILDSLENKPELQPFSEWRDHPFILDLVIYFIEQKSKFSLEGTQTQDMEAHHFDPNHQQEKHLVNDSRVDEKEKMISY